MNLQQLQTMLTIQDKTNSAINPEWKYEDLDFITATLVEAGELIEHIGCKKQDANIEQAKIKLVNIWHFGMSHKTTKEVDTHSKYILYQFNRVEFVADTKVNKVLPLTKMLISTLETEREFCLSTFRQLMYKLGMSTDELYQLYVVKNALNHFRHVSGYKTCYYKIWDGKEDYVVMMAELKKLDSTSPDLYNDLQAQLKYTYRNLMINDLLSN